MKKKIEHNTNLGLTAYQKAEIERISEKRDMSQQKVMRMMLDLGIECHKDMERVGIVSAVDFAYFVKEALKDRLATGKNKQLNLTW